MLMANYPAAIKEYEVALRLEKRPEIYLQLGEALTAAGRPEEGVQALLRAVLFNRALLEEISDGIARQRVEAELAAIQKRGGPCSGTRL